MSSLGRNRIGSYKRYPNIHRKIVHSCKRGSGIGSQDREFIEHLLSARVISGSFNREQIVREISHRTFDLSEIHLPDSIAIDKRAFIGQVIELHGHALPVRFQQTESQSAE